MQVGDPRSTILALLAARAPQATICPSEVARALIASSGNGETEDWRHAMPIVHCTIDCLLAEGHIRLSWKGRTLTKRAGPYRISRVRRE